MKNIYRIIVLNLFIGTMAFGAEEANPFKIEWNCQETPVCSTEAGNYSGGYAVIGGTYYIDGGSASSCCRIGKNIRNSACKDGHDPKGAMVKCS